MTHALNCILLQCDAYTYVLTLCSRIKLIHKYNLQCEGYVEASIHLKDLKKCWKPTSRRGRINTIKTIEACKNHSTLCRFYLLYGNKYLSIYICMYKMYKSFFPLTLPTPYQHNLRPAHSQFTIPKKTLQSLV